MYMAFETSDEIYNIILHIAHCMYIYKYIYYQVDVRTTRMTHQHLIDAGPQSRWGPSCGTLHMEKLVKTILLCIYNLHYSFGLCEVRNQLHCDHHLLPTRWHPKSLVICTPISH